MSRFFNKRLPFFGSSVLSFGKVYFGVPDTDPLNQEDNAQAPFVDRRTSIEADATQSLSVSGMVPHRLFLNRPCSVAAVDTDDNLIDYDTYYGGESSDNLTNTSSVAGATVTDALNTLNTMIDDVEADLISYAGIWPVGALYLTTEDENPGSRLNFGQWDLYCSGNLLCGNGEHTDADLNTVNMTPTSQGEYQVSLVADQIPMHRHMVVRDEVSLAPTRLTADRAIAVEWVDTGNNDQYILKGHPTEFGVADISPTSYTGGGEGHDNIQPCIGVYIWRRVS